MQQVKGVASIPAEMQVKSHADDREANRTPLSFFTNPKRKRNLLNMAGTGKARCCALLLQVALLCCSGGVLSATVTISNVSPRRNSTGDVIDAHDGTTSQWGGPGSPWYYYAMGYGMCKQDSQLCNNNNHCGYGYSWIGVWRSPNLATNGSWEMVRGEAREEGGGSGGWPKAAVYFRVHVVYRKAVDKYIMWVNVDGSPHCPAQQCGAGQMCACYFVGESDTPDGAFRYVGAAAGRYVGGGDFDIITDNVNDTAFIIYTATQQGHVMSVEKLSDSWLNTSFVPQENNTMTSGSSTHSTPPPDPAPIPGISSGIIGNRFVEAPAIFRRKGTYYALFGECCCFCAFGSGIGVYTASHPLGPWRSHEANIGCSATDPPKPGCGCGMHGGSPAPLQCANLEGTSVTKAQQNFVIPFHTARTSGGNETSDNVSVMEYLWTGDMWQSSSDGYKAHDLQYTYLLEWALDESSGLDLPRAVVWKDSFEIDII